MTISLFTISLFVASLLIGFMPVLLDGIKELMGERSNLNAGRAEWPARWFYFSWLPAMPLAGWALDAWPAHTKEILFLALVALILGIAWLALTRSLMLLVLNATLLGVVYSLITTAAVSMMATAFFAPPNLFAGLQAGFVAVGLGALIAPWIVRAIKRWAGYRQGLLYVSVALIVPAALIALCDGQQFAVAHPRVAWDRLLTDAHLAMIVVVILVYFAIENCLEFWPESYLKELGYRDRGMHTTMTIFWLCFIAMRGGAAWWLYEHPTHGIGLTLLFLILASLVIGNLVSGYEVGSGTFGFWLLGACYGPLLPGLLAVAFDLYPQPLPTSAQGALLALSGLDTLVVRPLMTVFEKGRPARTVMRVPTVLALFMAAPLVLLFFLRQS
jgi:MFS family permease